MHGLKQAGKIACDDLKKHLQPHGYVPAPHTPGLWQHLHSDLTFTLIVDDFGIKHTNLQQVHDLILTLKKRYEITVDWTGTLCAGVTLTWNYLERTVILSTPNYVKKLLIECHHPIPRRAQYTPRQPEPIVFAPPATLHKP